VTHPMPDPQKFDAALAQLHYDRAAAEQTLTAVRNQVHRAAGDKRSYGRARWTRNFADVLAVAPAALTEKYDWHSGQVAALTAKIQAADVTYRQYRWSRFILCLSANGHVHNATRCSTLRYDTPLEWRPELSGQSAGRAVEDLGPALCSVCFPGAPVEARSKTLTQVAQERSQGERDAARAARTAKAAAKTLTAAEQFRTARNRELVTTVYALKELIRQPVEQAVELAWYGTPEAAAKWDGMPERLAQATAYVTATLATMTADAAEAERVLLAREAGHAGWGATAAEIAKMRASKDKAARKAWGV
jgi:hypothetical protein